MYAAPKCDILTVKIIDLHVHVNDAQFYFLLVRTQQPTLVGKYLKDPKNWMTTNDLNSLQNLKTEVVI